METSSRIKSHVELLYSFGDLRWLRRLGMGSLKVVAALLLCHRNEIHSRFPRTGPHVNTTTTRIQLTAATGGGERDASPNVRGSHSRPTASPCRHSASQPCSARRRLATRQPPALLFVLAQSQGRCCVVKLQLRSRSAHPTTSCAQRRTRFE